jgi:hypothetical protein
MQIAVNDAVKNTASILADFLLKKSREEILGIYEMLLSESTELGHLKIDELSFLQPLLDSKSTIKNIGIDLPIMLDTGKPVLMIIALDPKRNDASKQAADEISIGSVFNLHCEAGRQAKNNYFSFIEPLLDNYSVYLTDVYKVYFESYEKDRYIVSNKLKEYVDFKIDMNTDENLTIHRRILELEIAHLNPQRIITLGVHAENALKSILNKETYDDTYLFMPHISRTVTQSIPVVARMLSSLGKLNNDPELIKIGDAISRYKLFYNK